MQTFENNIAASKEHFIMPSELLLSVVIGNILVSETLFYLVLGRRATRWCLLSSMVSKGETEKQESVHVSSFPFSSLSLIRKSLLLVYTG